MSPMRVTVKVNAVGVDPVPSTLTALVAAIDSEASSLLIVPLAVIAAAVPRVAPPVGADSVTLKPSLPSTRLSAKTLIGINFVVSPAKKLTVPVGNFPPTKSVAADAVAPVPFVADANFTLAGTLIPPVRVTVNVSGVELPSVPSRLLASVAAIVNVASSLRIVPFAVAVSRTPPMGFDSVTVKPLSGSNVVSPFTLIVTVAVAAPAANLTRPVGNTVPKSATSAELSPLPVTA